MALNIQHIPLPTYSASTPTSCYSASSQPVYTPTLQPTVQRHHTLFPYIGRSQPCLNPLIIRYIDWEYKVVLAKNHYFYFLYEGTLFIEYNGIYTDKFLKHIMRLYSKLNRLSELRKDSIPIPPNYLHISSTQWGYTYEVIYMDQSIPSVTYPEGKN